MIITIKILEEDHPLAGEAGLPRPIDIALYPLGAAEKWNVGIME